MAINDIVQTVADARVDARSLSDFVFKPAGFKVPRRLAPPIDTLQFYIDRFDATKATTDAYVATIPTIVNDAINNTAVDGGVLADTFVTMTANGVGTVPRSLRDVNSDTTNLLNFIPPSEMAAIKNRTSTYDCSAALAAAVATGKRVIVPTAGTYKFIAGYSGTTDFDVEATTSGVVFDFNDSSAPYPIENTGSLTKLELVYTNPSKGDFKVAFTSVGGISEGDWLCFYCPIDYSYSQWRAGYRAGEWVKVREIKANVVYFEKPFTDSLVGLSLELYKLNSVVCRIANIALDRKVSMEGVVKFSLSSAASDHNITVDTTVNSVIYYDRCVVPESSSIKGKNKGKGADDYIISIANCQSPRVHNPDIYSRRHAIALGSGVGVCTVPVTDFRCYKGVLKCDPESLVGAADMHGNVRDSSYEDCVIYGGSNIGGGDNTWYKRCEIHSDAKGTVGFSREIVGGSFGWVDCNIHINGSAVSLSKGVFDIGGNSSGITDKAKSDVNITLKNINIISSTGTDASIGESFLSGNARGSNVNINITVDGLTSSVSPKFSTIIRFSADAANADFNTPATAVMSKGMVVDNLVGINAVDLFRSTDRGVGVYDNVPMRMQKQQVTVSAALTIGLDNALTNKMNYPIRYPREPQILSHINAVGTASPFNGLGGQPVYHLNKMVEASRAGLKLGLPLTQKFTVADTLTAKFVVGINEV